MGTLDESTSIAELAVFMLAIGLGVGMVMQNLVLVVQNTLEPSQMGSGSALVAFFRSLAGAIGVSALGAILAARASSGIDDVLAARGIELASRHGAPPPEAVAPVPVPAER
jgi:hypothetical protein